MKHRLATVADFDAVYQLYMAPSVVPYLGYDSMARDSFAPIFDELLSTHNFFLCESHDAELIGFYRATRYAGRAHHVVYLGTIAVAPRLHGSGAALEMLSNVIARFESAGVLRFELLVESDNPRAIAFYNKLGFEIEGRQRMAFKRAHQAHYVDELMMARVTRE